MKEVCNFSAILVSRSTTNRPDNFGLYLSHRKIENLVQSVRRRDDVLLYGPHYYYAALCTYGRGSGDFCGLGTT